MAAIPQISTPVSSGKSYSGNLSTNSGTPNQGSPSFDISELPRPVETQSIGEHDAGNPRSTMGQKELAPMSVAVRKDPALAVETLKDVLNGEILSSAKVNGYTELEGDLDTLTKALYLKPEQLVDEILSQENDNTMFSGNKLYDLLREINAAADKANNTDVKESIGALLKSINFAVNRDDILKALSANTKFLSEYFAPNKNLSAKLSELSEQWGADNAGDNFEALKSATASLMKNVSESLLNDEKTQTLLPLVIYNLSRYNTNTSMIKDSFSQLLAQISSSQLRSELSGAFEELLGQLDSAVGNTAQNAQPSAAEAGEVRVYEPNRAEQNEVSTDYNTTNDKINQPLNAFFGKDNQIPQYLADKLNNPEYVKSLNLDFDDFEAPLKSYLLGKTDGLTAIRDILSSLVGDVSQLESLSREVMGMKGLDQLVDYLNGVLKSMPDIEERQGIYDALVEVVNSMAANKELPAEANSDNAAVSRPVQQSPADSPTMEKLTDFISKNINHAALKSVDNYNASNLLQSMLNAPGVMTPLAHYIVPLQIEDTKAFGELWVDNDDDSHKKTTGEKSYHLFLTFDVDSIGRFEVDMVAGGKDVNMSLLHPESFSEKIRPLTARINRIITRSGYNAADIRTGVLKTPRSLTEVFPKILERRTGLNVKA